MSANAIDQTRHPRLWRAGSGKTTLATALASEIRFPLLSMDRIKETLLDTLGGPASDLEYSRRLGSAAMEQLWAVATYCPSVVLEANFRPRSEYERERILSLDAELIEVHCRCAPNEAARRFAERARSGGRHPAHPLRSLPAELLAEYDLPIGIGTLLVVETTGPIGYSLSRRADRTGVVHTRTPILVSPAEGTVLDQ